MCILECIFSSHLYGSAGQLLNIFKASSRDSSGREYLKRNLYLKRISKEMGTIYLFLTAFR